MAANKNRRTPTSPGVRFASIQDKGLVQAVRPLKSKCSSLANNAGRNNTGRITIRHRSGKAHKRIYREIDWKRIDKDLIPGTVATIEYDPNRSAHIALIHYVDGDKRYILAPEGLKQGDQIVSGDPKIVRPGSNFAIGKMQSGTVIHCLETKVGKGAQMLRSAGVSGQICGTEDVYTSVKLRSGEMRYILSECRASIGRASNSPHNLRSLGKAGIKRHLGWRPTVRGEAMNPVDHPHGGGEGKTRGRHPRSAWGKIARGLKTRQCKRTDAFIIKRRTK